MSIEKLEETTEAEEWREKEIYYDKEGNVKCATFSKEKIGKCAMKIPIKVEVRMGEEGLDRLEEITRKVDELRNGHPLTETHFIIDLT